MGDPREFSIVCPG